MELKRFAAPLNFERINTAGSARVRRGMDADARFKLIVSKFIESRDEIQLRIFGIGHVHFILAERHHAGQSHHRMRMSALFQNLNEQFTDERLSGGRAFDQNAVARFDASRMFHQNFCKFLNASISHRNLPIQIIALTTALKLY